jgi:hypothetical protein
MPERIERIFVTVEGNNGNYKKERAANHRESERTQTYGSPVMSEKEMFAAVGEPRKSKGYQQVNNGFQSRPPRRDGSDSQHVASWAQPPSTRTTRRPIPAAETGAVHGDNRGMRNYEDHRGNRLAKGPMSMDGVRKGSIFRGTPIA